MQRLICSPRHSCALVLHRNRPESLWQMDRQLVRVPRQVPHPDGLVIGTTNGNVATPVCFQTGNRRVVSAQNKRFAGVQLPNYDLRRFAVGVYHLRVANGHSRPVSSVGPLSVAISLAPHRCGLCCIPYGQPSATADLRYGEQVVVQARHFAVPPIEDFHGGRREHRQDGLFRRERVCNGLATKEFDITVLLKEPLLAQLRPSCSVTHLGPYSFVLPLA
mmetsp:Transcript_31152/g.58054  ORF Transcript_31152/g.58054 Transcript_31152/m.58054 type:complete len:219 (-) Transcript_31152:187-843(-)